MPINVCGSTCIPACAMGKQRRLPHDARPTSAVGGFSRARIPQPFAEIASKGNVLMTLNSIGIWRRIELWSLGRLFSVMMWGLGSSRTNIVISGEDLPGRAAIVLRSRTGIKTSEGVDGCESTRIPDITHT